MKRLRLWALRRHYCRIAEIEAKLDGDLDAAALRRDFAAESVGFINGHFKRQGIPRAQRRQFGRAVARGGR